MSFLINLRKKWSDQRTAENGTIEAFIAAERLLYTVASGALDLLGTLTGPIGTVVQIGAICAHQPTVGALQAAVLSVDALTVFTAKQSSLCIAVCFGRLAAVLLILAHGAISKVAVTPKFWTNKKIALEDCTHLLNWKKKVLQQFFRTVVNALAWITTSKTTWTLKVFCGDGNKKKEK